MKTLRKIPDLYGRLKELISNPAVKFSDCVNADKTTSCSVSTWSCPWELRGYGMTLTVHLCLVSALMSGDVPLLSHCVCMVWAKTGLPFPVSCVSGMRLNLLLLQHVLALCSTGGHNCQSRTEGLRKWLIAWMAKLMEMVCSVLCISRNCISYMI